MYGVVALAWVLGMYLGAFCSVVGAGLLQLPASLQQAGWLGAPVMDLLISCSYVCYIAASCMGGTYDRKKQTLLSKE